MTLPDPLQKTALDPADREQAQRQSMTGFARSDGTYKDYYWTFEIRSVNARGFDWRTRLPVGFDDLDLILRKKAQTRFSRGALSVTLTLRAPAAEQSVRVNETALLTLIKACETLRAKAPDIAPPSADGLLGLRGVLEIEDQPVASDMRDGLVKAIAASFDEVAEALAAARAGEGAALQQTLNTLIDEIAALFKQASALADASAPALRARLAADVDRLVGDQAIDEARLAQEIAQLAVKADVREELDRLHAHIDAARALLARSAPIGRAFDFLVQELNREANTLCAKAATLDLKQVGLSLKTCIDQLREQIQNVE